MYEWSLPGKDPDVGKKWRQEEKGMTEDDDSVIEATNMNLTKLREEVEDRRAWCALVHGITKSWTRLNA